MKNSTYLFPEDKNYFGKSMTEKKCWKNEHLRYEGSCLAPPHLSQTVRKALNMPEHQFAIYRLSWIPIFFLLKDVILPYRIHVLKNTRICPSMLRNYLFWDDSKFKGERGSEKEKTQRKIRERKTYLPRRWSEGKILMIFVRISF